MRELQLAQHLDRAIQLAGAAVDQDQIGQLGPGSVVGLLRVGGCLAGAVLP